MLRRIRTRHTRQARRAREEGEFEAEVLRVSREAMRPVVQRGAARLEEDEDEGGAHIRLLPANPRACELTIYPDYPTVCAGDGTTEMFGPEHERLRELPLLIAAVIRGGYEWEVGQDRFLGLLPFWRYKGTFHTDEGPWTFTRMGVSVPRQHERGSYEPY